MSLLESLKNFFYDEKDTETFDGDSESVLKSIKEIHETNHEQNVKQILDNVDSSELTEEQKEQLKVETLSKEQTARDYFTNIRISAESVSETQQTEKELIEVLESLKKAKELSEQEVPQEELPQENDHENNVKTTAEEEQKEIVEEKQQVDEPTNDAPQKTEESDETEEDCNTDSQEIIDEIINSQKDEAEKQETADELEEDNGKPINNIFGESTEADTATEVEADEASEKTSQDQSESSAQEEQKTEAEQIDSKEVEVESTQASAEQSHDEVVEDIQNDSNNAQFVHTMIKSTTEDSSSMTSEEPRYIRPSWDEYFINIANEVSSRATCDRGRSGCVIVRDNQILVAGYVGSPIGLPHCDDVGHTLRKTIREDGTTSEHCVRTVHAEQNAICQAARRGIPIDGATLYCRMTPCRVCAMLIINCGIKRVVCERKYQRAQDAEEMFKQSNIELTYIHNEVQKYNKN